MSVTKDGSLLLQYTHVAGAVLPAVMLWFSSSLKKEADNHPNTLWDISHESWCYNEWA